jgi:beta-lactamase regulating signal transducer with metallopeptidase domain
MTVISLPIVLDAVAKASVILAATALVAAALGRASASARHFVWTLGLLSALAAPALSVALPRWELPIVRVNVAPPAAREPAPLSTRQAPVLTHNATAIAPQADHSTSLVAGPSTSLVAGPSTELGAGTASRITTSSGRSIPWRPILLFTWMAGAAVILGRMFLGLAAVQWMSRRTPVVTDAPWLAQAQTLAHGLGLTRVRFLRADASRMPMAWGIVRSSVLMPADADTWPADRLRVVLLHELAHVKRRDCLTHLVAQMACAVYWFNPLAWMAARRLRTERERACDDLVLASGTRGSDYADQLLDIARVMRAGRFPAVLSGASLAMARRSQLEGRLMAILDPGVPRGSLTRARAAAAATLFAVLIVPVASVQPWADARPPSPLRGYGEAGAASGAGAAVKVSETEVTQQQQKPQDPQQAQKPIESYPGQADADNRANATHQDVIQGMTQDIVQGSLRGTIQGGVAGGVASGIGRGVSAGLGSGIGGGVASGIASGISRGVASGIAGAIGSGVAMGIPHEFPVEVQGGKEKEKDKDSWQGRTRDPRTVNALVEALKDTDKDVRETAVNALVQMRDPRIFDPLVAALKDASADVREQAAFGLGQLRDARAVDPLSAALKDQNASVREQAVFALGQLRAASAIDAITPALRDTNADVREQAAFALGQIRDRRTVEPLISALKDEKPNVREQAAFALGQMRDPKSIEALVIALKDANADVREQAAFALGQIGDARAIDGLTAALKDMNPSVRQQAAFALGQIR